MKCTNTKKTDHCRLQRVQRWPQATSLSNVALVPRRCVEMEGGMHGGGHTRSDVEWPSLFVVGGGAPVAWLGATMVVVDLLW